MLGLAAAIVYGYEGLKMAISLLFSYSESILPVSAGMLDGIVASTAGSTDVSTSGAGSFVWDASAGDVCSISSLVKASTESAGSSFCSSTAGAVST